MKLFLLAITVIATASLIGAPPTSGVTYVPHDKVAEALAKGGTLVTANDLLVSGSHRDKNGTVELHEKETDIFYIVDGEATYVTGGKMIGGHATKPGQMAGTSIEGGQTFHLSKGDVIVTPAGTPHWFKETHNISYYVVKVLKP